MSNLQRVGSAVFVTAASCALLVGCGSVSAGDNPSGSSSTAGASTPNPTFTPRFDASGDAQKNQAYFEYVVSGVIAKSGITTDTMAMAKALVAAGFAKSGIEFGDSFTAIGMKPDSVMVAAKQGTGCLIAQYGHSINGLAVSVQPALSTGGCLIGRSINHL